MLISPDELASIPPQSLQHEIDLFLRAWEDPQSVIFQFPQPRQQGIVQAALGSTSRPSCIPHPSFASSNTRIRSGLPQSSLALSPVAEEVK